MISTSANQRGFTLIEVIVTIVVSAILAVLLMQVIGGHAWRSYWPLTKIDQGLGLRTAMENITSDYRNLLMTDAKPLETLQSRISSNPPYYWSGNTIAVTENNCLDDVHQNNATPAGEVRVSGNAQCLHPVDTILKVTLSFEGQSLTALFTR